MSKRKLGNWVDSWLEYTDQIPSPPIWRKWAGIFILGSAMERRLWIKTNIAPLYGNLYVIFVGPPGVGKTNLTSRVAHFLRGLSDAKDSNSFHVASSSLTHASVIDELKNAERRYVFPNMKDILEYNALTIVSNELGVLLPEYDAFMMPKLTDLYDGHSYSERRRTKDLNFTIEAPVLSILAACTPSYMTETLPPGAWDQGFLSRTMIAYSAETVWRDIFAEIPVMEKLEAELQADLRHILSLSGKMMFTAEALDSIKTWDKGGRSPLPEHPKLYHYNTRRLAHALKLSMISALAREDTLQITRDDFLQGLDWLVEIETYMPEIFKAMNTGGDSRVMEEVWYHVSLIYQKEGNNPIAESRILAHLAERLPATNVARVMDVMVKTGVFKEEFTGHPGNWYSPRTRRMN
jgi:DNA polymerase III delta prime subunit